MSSYERVTESVSALSRFFVGDGTVQETLDRVAGLACDAVPGADMAGITMLVEGRPTTAVFTDETAPEIDSAQYETGSGPCLDAFRHRMVFRLPDTREANPWPEFAKTAAAHGLHSVLSLPMVANHEGIGALNLYSREVDAFSDEDAHVGSRFADHAAIVLANSQAYWDARLLGEGLGEAMKSRATIEQAKGILMGAQRCTADEAFQILVRASQRENRKLRDVAAQLVVNATVARPRSQAGRSA
jgi:GAF domain-containing protein